MHAFTMIPRRAAVIIFMSSGRPLVPTPIATIRLAKGDDDDLPEAFDEVVWRDSPSTHVA
jgi:hypothetical protein